MELITQKLPICAFKFNYLHNKKPKSDSQKSENYAERLIEEVSNGTGTSK